MDAQKMARKMGMHWEMIGRTTGNEMNDKKMNEMWADCHSAC